MELCRRLHPFWPLSFFVVRGRRRGGKRLPQGLAAARLAVGPVPVGAVFRLLGMFFLVSFF